MGLQRRGDVLAGAWTLLMGWDWWLQQGPVGSLLHWGTRDGESQSKSPKSHAEEQTLL